jgi:hypothetical protein
MPQILRTPWDTLAITCTVASQAYCIVLRRGTSRFNAYPAVNPGLFSWDETDQAAFGAHAQPIPLNALYSTEVPSKGYGNLARQCGILHVETLPVNGTTTTIGDGTTTVVFEYTAGGGVTIPGATEVNKGANVNACALSLATAISASALLMEADRGIRDTSEVHWITAVAGTTITVTDGTTGKVDNLDLGLNHVPVYVGSTIAGTAMVVSCEAETVSSGG